MLKAGLELTLAHVQDFLTPTSDALAYGNPGVPPAARLNSGTLGQTFILMIFHVNDIHYLFRDYNIPR